MLIALFASSAHAVKIGDVTRLGGQRQNTLTGFGLVYGLKGTGDGGNYLPAIKPLVAAMGKYANATTVKELAAASNVAIVFITATIPASGARAGDAVDIYISSVGAASTLKGGRLAPSPLVGPLGDGDIMAVGSGPAIIEDPSNPLTARISGGAVLEISMPSRVVNERGTFLLVLDEPAASYSNASMIASVINDDKGDGKTIAVVRDAKTIEVLIPQPERPLPDSFIGSIQRLPFKQYLDEARVTINARTGTMVITGDVEISPVAISYKGLTVTVPAPPAPGQPAAPAGPVVKSFIPVQTDAGESPSETAKLEDLVAALNQLKVPADDRIIIIRDLHKSGKLHAKLVEE